MRLLIALAAMILPACNFDTPVHPEFDRGANVPIKYEYVKNGFEMAVLCPSKDGRITLGCAFIPATKDGVCVVVLYPNDYETKAHEEAHCRYGRWHS